MMGLVLDPFAGELFSAVKGGGAFCNGQPIHTQETPAESALIVFGTAPYYRGRPEERHMVDATFSMAKELFLRCGDLRRSGSAAVDLCRVAAGRCDGFFELCLSPWDYAAGAVILQEAGAVIGTLPGQPFRYDQKQAILAGTKTLYPLLEQLAGKYL